MTAVTARNPRINPGNCSEERLKMCAGCVSRWLLLFCLSLVLVQSSPLTQDQTQDQQAPKTADTALPYNSYLRQVVEYLEKDPHFREKLRSINISDIMDGKLSQELDFVHHSVRTKLDEIKREEMVRLRMLLKAKRDLKLGNGRLRDHQALLRHFEHLDFSNPHSFEVQDLDRLIKAATRDLKEVDQKQHEAFKQYEMMKEHERRERLKKMTQEERQREEQQYEEQRRRHAEHPKLNHPGSEDQLKEVWQETDGLDESDFNPKTFFRLHDSNRDGFFDETELEALFTKELEKAYDPEKDDLIEMEEERLRMREHVFSEVDRDGDGLISEQEFIESTEKDDFHHNQEWQTLDHKPSFTEEELLQFEEHLINEHNKLFTRTEDLEKQKQELEEKQKELDAQRQGLEQMMEQMQKLRGITWPQEQHHEDGEVHESRPEPAQA